MSKRKKLKIVYSDKFDDGWRFINMSKTPYDKSFDYLEKVFSHWINYIDQYEFGVSLDIDGVNMEFTSPFQLEMFLQGFRLGANL